MLVRVATRGIGDLSERVALENLQERARGKADAGQDTMLILVSLSAFSCKWV